MIDVQCVSEWEEVTVFTPAKYNPETGEICLDKNPDRDECRREYDLLREYIVLPNGDEIDICPDCGEYVLKTVMVDNGTSALEEIQQCSNQECVELYEF